MVQLFSNNVRTKLAVPLTSSDVVMEVVDATGMPTITGDDFFVLTVELNQVVEIVKVTSRVGNTLTVVRGYEGTTPTSYSSDATVELRLTAGFLNRMSTHRKYELVATAGQTVITVDYTVGTVDVHVNGLKLSATDYTADNGVTITLNSPLTAGDVIAVDSYSIVNVADTYSTAEVDTKVGTVSDKMYELHDAQAAIIAGLATSQGAIENAVTPVFASIPKDPLTGVLDFVVTTPSTNDNIFELDATNNVFKFKQAASYTFLSDITIKSNVSAARLLTFRLINNTTNAVLGTVVKNLIIASGNTESYTMSTLLVADTAPVDVRVEVTCSDTGYEFRAFSSVVTSSAGYGSENVDSINSALGGLLGGTTITQVIEENAAEAVNTALAMAIALG